MTSSTMNTEIQTAIDELHRCFALLNSHLFQNELPTPAILIQWQGTRTRIIYGWCIQEQIWKSQDKVVQRYEINITAEHLSRPLMEVMHTLLHEMVHLSCAVNEIQDCSRGGSYHNKKFKQHCEIHGLNCEKSPGNDGFSVTSLMPDTVELIDSFGINEGAFTIQRYTWGDPDGDEEGKEKKKTKRTKSQWVCPNCKLAIKSNKELNIICGKCLKKFEKVEEADEDEDE